jgi:hypothetical protein
MTDPILNEIRKNREEILQSYGSLRAYHNAIVEQQKEYADRLVSLPPKRKKEISSKKG